MSHRGVDIRESGDRIIFRALGQGATGNLISVGETRLYVYEIQDDGTFKSYDFDDGTFKTTALTTEYVAMTHQTGNNGATNTGVWTYSLTTVTGFTAGRIYVAMVMISGASPSYQHREFQYGSGVLADLIADTITSAKYDESTAYPVAAADTGATQIARVGADGDTLETLSDQLDAQATAAALATTDGKVDSILEDTGTTLPASLATTDGKVDSVLEDTGTTLPATLATIDGKADAIVEDTGTTLPATLATIAGYIDAEVAAILEDTGTTLPAQIAALNNLSSAAAQAACAAALAAYDGPTNAEMEARTITAATYATAAALSSAATDITIIRKLRQNRLEFDIANSKAYIWNDAGLAREYVSTMTDNDGAAVTVDTTGPINCSRWTAV